MSGEAFSLSLSRKNLEDCSEDAGIRAEDLRERADVHEDAKSKDHQLIGLCVPAGELQQGHEVAEEVGDFGACTEGQLSHEAGVHK